MTNAAKRDKIIHAGTAVFGSPLDPHHVFESFVEGASNRIALSAAKKVAEAKALCFNPLFIHASVGLGTTHLLQAIATAALKHSVGQVVYLTAEFYVAVRHGCSL